MPNQSVGNTPSPPATLLLPSTPLKVQIVSSSPPEAPADPFLPQQFHIKSELDLSIFISALAFFAAVMGLYLNLWQIRSKRKGDEASFIINYVSKIYTDAELRDSFYTLVDNYDDDLFRSVDEIATKQALRVKAQKDGRPIFQPFAHLQNGRVEGQRLYHPECFQGSLEERKLDAVLGYFDAIGHYYHSNKQISIRLLAQYLNYHLMMLAGRAVIQRYFEKSSDQEYLSGPVRRLAGDPQIPFYYVRLLVAHFVEHNRTNQPTILQERRSLALARHALGPASGSRASVPSGLHLYPRRPASSPPPGPHTS